jgi:uncharacterized membrane protein YdjX (TVP38/TMEM64 family)
MKVHKLARQLPLGVILVVAALGFAFLRDDMGFASLAVHQQALIAYRDAHMHLAVVVFIAAYAGLVAFSLPGATLATITGGFLFGLWPGVVWNVTGATLGATLIFLAARAGLGERLAAKMEASPGALHRFKHGIDANQWSVLFLVRLVPLVPFFVANLLPALFAVPLHRYVITTAIGIIPGAIVITSLGAGLGDVIAAGEMPDMARLTSPEVLLPLIGLAALAALPILLRAMRREVRA